MTLKISIKKSVHRCSRIKNSITFGVETITAVGGNDLCLLTNYNENAHKLSPFLHTFPDIAVYYPMGV